MTPNKHKSILQLPFDFTLKESGSFASFYPGANQLLVDLLLKMSSASGEQQLFLWSAGAHGKTHLLQALCRAASQQPAGVASQTVYLPMNMIADLAPAMLEGLEDLSLIVIDDCHLITTAQQPQQWETSLFDLINRCRDSGCKLVLSANAAPSDLGLSLADLVSRLSWGPVFQLQALNDDEKVSALSLHASLRGFELSEEVGRYLVQRFSREQKSQFDLLDQLDSATLAAKRKLTIPFIKSVTDS